MDYNNDFYSRDEKIVLNNAEEIRRQSKRFSWGGFAFGTIYGLFNRVWEYPIIFALGILADIFFEGSIPNFVPFILNIAISFNARKISLNRYKNSMRTADDVDKWIKRQKVWDTVGIIGIILEIFIVIFMIIFIPTVILAIFA